jgi:hypothetical protein
MTTYTYDANSNTATVKYANNYKSSYTYDDGNRTTQHTIKNAATPPVTPVAWAFCPRTSRAHTRLCPYEPAGLPSNAFGYSRKWSQVGGHEKKIG